MENRFDHYIFDLDETIADSRYLKDERDRAAINFSLRPALYDRIGLMNEFPGAANLIAELKDLGGKVTILTNSWEEYARKVVAHLKFNVDEIIAPARKPNPESLLKVRDNLARYRPSTRSIHIGDGIKDLRASVGAQTGFVLCLWGEQNGSIYSPRHDETDILIGQATDISGLRKIITIL